MPAYRYTFTAAVPIEEIEASILLAIIATENLHGETQVRIDAAHFLDPDERTCTICAGTLVGQDFNRMFAGFMRREFGDDSFEVEPVRALYPDDESDKRPS